MPPLHEKSLSAMTDSRVAFAHEAELRLHDGIDPAAVGAAVTTALCGHWEHEGPCRWPHNNDIELDESVAFFRTIFVAHATEEDEVRERIERSLRAGDSWVVLRTNSRPVSRPEEPLARRLATTPLP
jgi:hypothetical protein